MFAHDATVLAESALLRHEKSLIFILRS
jgi:hypothetical protein